MSEGSEATTGTLPGEKWSPYIFGIDLGTSNSCISIFRKGASEVVPVEGNPTCPSVMTVLKNGDIVVGRQAQARLMIDPENTVASVKRKMGQEWSKEFEGLPDKQYSPTDISAEVLAKLTMAAQDSEIDLRGAPRYAVVCIPANFNDAQKTATKEAAQLAGIEVLSLLEEPSAAALAYACERDRDQTILVYDLGGGTFDAAILKVDSKGGSANFEFLAKEGIHELGGDDFDKKIMELAAAKVLEESGVDILDDKKDQGIKARSLREAQQKMKEAAETAKCELTETASAEITLPNLIKDEEGKVHSLEFSLTRDEFNDAIRPLILQSKEAVEKALKDADLEMADISRIILVGGSTLVPLVKEMLTEMFGKEPYGDANPHTVVSRGAAIYGAHLGVPSDPDTNDANAEDEFGGTIDIKDIVTHHLGIEIAGGKFNCIIEKGTEIPEDGPLAATKQYGNQRDNQTEIKIAVFQSLEEVEFVSEDSAECIGEFYLSGIPPKPKGQEKIDVTFEIDRQNLLHVHAKSSSSEGELEIQRD